MVEGIGCNLWFECISSSLHSYSICVSRSSSCWGLGWEILEWAAKIMPCIDYIVHSSFLFTKSDHVLALIAVWTKVEVFAADFRSGAMNAYV